MAFTENKVPYSETEKAILRHLPQDGSRISTDVLLRKHYKGRSTPFHARKIVVGIMSSIVAKSQVNGGPFTVRKSERRGPHPIEFWIERKKR